MLPGFLYGVEALKSVILTVAAAERKITPEKAVYLSRLELEFQVFFYNHGFIYLLIYIFPSTLLPPLVSLQPSNLPPTLPSLSSAIPSLMHTLGTLLVHL